MTTDAWLTNYIADRLRQVGADDGTAAIEAEKMRADIAAAFRTIGRLEAACGSVDG